MENKSKINIPNYAVSIVSFALVWGLLELMSHYLYKYLPDRFGNGKRIVDLNLGRGAKSASIVPHPYMLYTNNPGYNNGIQQHNSLGYRGKEFNPEKTPGTIRILALGGSTTYGYLVNEPDKTWPARLEQLLKASASREVEVINAGLKYGTSAELLASYVFRHRYLRPDIVIFHEGGNDAIPVLFPDYSPEYTHFRGHGNGVNLRYGERLLLKSNLFKVFYSLWLNSNETVYKAQPHSLAELDRNQAAGRVDNDLNFEGFRRNVDLLTQLAINDNAEVVLFGFVQAREHNLSRNRPDHAGLEKTVTRCVEKNKSIMRDLAARHNAVYIEAQQDLFRDEWFLDNCHLSPEGEEAKARFVMEKLLPLINARIPEVTIPLAQNSPR